MFEEPVQMKDLNEKDWIILRLLFYITSTDVSSATVKDIIRTSDYARLFYGTGTVLDAFDLIRREMMQQGEYDNPESAAMRKLKKSAEDAARKAVIDYERD